MKQIFLVSAVRVMGIGLVGLVGLSVAMPAMAEDFQQALVSAYQNNPRLMAERARVREVDENYVQAQAAGRFTINANASIGRSKNKTDFLQFGGVNSTSATLGPKSASLSIIQPLYQGGRVKGLKAQAKAGILSARQGLRNAEQNLLLSAATAYLDVLRDEEAAIIRRNNVRVLTRQRFAAQDRFDVGEGTRTDIAQADARLAASEIGLANADASLAVSRAAYVRFVGHAPANLTAPPQYILPPTLSEALNRGRANNPQLIAARYNENAAQSAIAVAKSAGRPTLSLNGTLQGSRESSANVPRSESASITAQLRIPIYSGGLNQSRVRAAKQAKIRSKFETRETEQAVDQTVANLWAQVVASDRSLVASKKQVAAAEIAFEGVELEQQVGTRNTLDVLDAEQEVLNAKLSVIQAERNFNVATYQMLVTIGGFDAYSLQLPVDSYDPRDNFNAVIVNSFGKYVPDAVETALDNIPEKTTEALEFVGGKVGKDLIDLANALLPDPASAEKVGQDVSDLAKAVVPKPVYDVTGKLIEQIPGIPKSALDAITIDDPFDPGTKIADPDFIDPEPILIITKQKPKTE
ncbi:MAG: TolC family outer membrane protein [Robiginitomaculum sp.]|nr:TolC family outer membrane protein [Robiginitomaculum sp.]